MKNYKKVTVYCLLATVVGSYGANASNGEKEDKLFRNRAENFAKKQGCPLVKNWDCEAIKKKFEEADRLVDTGPDAGVSAAQAAYLCRIVQDFCKDASSS